MHKNLGMQEETKGRTGRIPNKSCEYYSQTAKRPTTSRLVKQKFGSLGIDVLQCAQERMGQSDFFLFKLNSTGYHSIELEDQIAKADFIAVIEYCATELEIFDKVLFENGFLFSVDFVRNFNRAGLFRNRTYGISHIFNVANNFRPGHPPLTIEDELEIIAKSSTLPSQAKAAEIPSKTPLQSKNLFINEADEELPF